jgi:hypothetical protein
MTPVVVLVLRKPWVGQMSGRGGERKDGGRECPAELPTARDHNVSAAGRNAKDVQSVTACGPCDGMGFSLGRLGVGMVMLWIEKLDLGHPTGRSLG